MFYIKILGDVVHRISDRSTQCRTIARAHIATSTIWRSGFLFVLYTAPASGCILPEVTNGSIDIQTPVGQLNSNRSETMPQLSSSAAATRTDPSVPSSAVSGNAAATAAEPSPMAGIGGDRGSSVSNAGASGGGIQLRGLQPSNGGQAGAIPTSQKAASSTNGSAGAAGVSSPAVTCSSETPCNGAFNCVERVCTEPTSSCADHKSLDPEAEDGVYWINPKGKPMRAYCDMQERLELCTEVEDEHHGVTRESKKLNYTMSSQLRKDARVCEIWAVRETETGVPLGVVNYAGKTTCMALGFLWTEELKYCSYGPDQGCSNCGFNGAQDFVWTGECRFCTDNSCCLLDGFAIPVRYESYNKIDVRGVIVISSFDGTTRSSCFVVPP
jgi:hypothetical protein